MGRSDAMHAGLELVVEQFPGKAALVRRLVLRDEGFRGLCEDYALAQASLAGFVARSDAADRPEIAEYHAVIAELEREIGRFVQEAEPAK
jgi:hypothetical protein